MTKQRFRAEDWLELGLAELSRHGVDALKLEAICKAAGLTRGSFYYHFSDHESFLVALAERWFETHTKAVVDSLPKDGSVEDISDALSDAAMAIDYTLELGIRELARRVPAVNEVLQKADRHRLSIISDIYKRRFDLDNDTAARFAFLEYAAFSGLVLLKPDMSPDQQIALADEYDLMVSQFLSKEPPR